MHLIAIIFKLVKSFADGRGGGRDANVLRMLLLYLKLDFLKASVKYLCSIVVF